MTANHDLPRRVARYYETEPPLRAPDWVLRGALQTIETTPQRRGLTSPWRYRNMTIYTKLAAAVAVIAIGALAVWQLAPPGPGGVGTPSAPPSATPAVTPTPASTATPAPTAMAGRQSNFVRPFTYVLPAVPQFDFGQTVARFWEVRVPEWFEAGHLGGLIMQAVGAGRADPCDAASSAVPLAAGADAILAYLKTVDGITVTDESTTTVDGRPAVQATVRAEAPGSACPEIWAWTETIEPFITGTELRVIVVDLDGEPLVISIFGEPENPTLPEIADGIIGSLAFDPLPPPSG